VADCFGYGNERSGPVGAENLSVELLFNILYFFNEVPRVYTNPFQIIPPYIPSQYEPENFDTFSVSDGWNDFNPDHLYSLNIICPSMDIT
jgi:hypothetical protein